MELDYTVETEKPFDDAVAAVEHATEDAGFRVVFVHDVAETLAEKGLHRDRVTIVELCNATYAAKVLEADVKIGLLLPCPIVVYAQDGKNYISTMRPTSIGSFFPEAGIDDVAKQVEDIIVGIIDTAAA